MVEQVGVRLSVTGGTQFRSEMTAAGRDGSIAMDRISKSGKSMGFAVQNAGYQIGDFAVQVAGGQSATRAFAQQMPQLLGSFGVFGAVAGAGVAVMAALTPLFAKGAESAAEMAKKMGGLEGSVGAVKSATSALETVQKQYNDAISKTGGASSSAAALVAANSEAEFKARKNVLEIEMQLLSIRGREQAESLKNLEDVYNREAGAIVSRRPKLDGPLSGIEQARGRSRLRGDPQQAREFDKFLRDNELARIKIRQLRLEYDETAKIIASTEKLMAMSFDEIMTGTPGTTTTGAGVGQNALLAETSKLFDETRTRAERYAIELANLDALYAKGAISAEVYLRKQELLRQEFEAAGTFAQAAAGTVKSSMDSLFDSMFEGSKKAEEAIENLGKSLLSMAAKQSTYQLLAQLLPKTFGADGFIPLLKNADGNAFEAGRLTAFASGGIVNRPTLFPMRGGTGLMGEAGPEAIMPLTRIGGKLGVRGAGGGGTVVQMIDQRSSGAPVREERSRGPDGRELVRLIVADETARGSFDAAQRSRFGAIPTRVKR